MSKIFYRVCNTETQQGLWYDFEGDFTGLIHDEFSFCRNRDLRMPNDPEIVGWLSATETVQDLFAWFTREDIVKLQEHGFFIHEYEATQCRQYKNHWVIDQATSRPVNIITLTPISK